jgi:hypothetical protein
LRSVNGGFGLRDPSMKTVLAQRLASCLSCHFKLRKLKGKLMEMKAGDLL